MAISCMSHGLSAAVLGKTPAISPLALADLTWTGPIEVVSGGGHKGPWRMNASECHYFDDPAVAINEKRTIGMVFADLRRNEFQALVPLDRGSLP